MFEHRVSIPVGGARLGQQIQEPTEPAASARPSWGGDSAAVTRSRGWGGPQSAQAPVENRSTSSPLEPTHVTALSKAVETKALMDGQLVDMARLRESLTDGKAAIAERLEYLAHRPSGLAVADPVLTDHFAWRWSPFGTGRQYHEGLDLAQRTHE